MNIKWEDVVTNVVSAVVIAIVAGAVTIVWTKATSVDTKVRGVTNTTTKMVSVVADEISQTKVQITSLSNQLAIVITNQENIIRHINSDKPTDILGNPLSISPVVLKPSLKYIQQSIIREDPRIQKGISRDIEQSIMQQKR